MGLTESKVDPTSKRIPVTSALEGHEDDTIGKNLQEDGFVIFRLDQELHEHVLNFFECGKKFFSQSSDEKRQFLAEQDPIRNAVRKKNEGYVDASVLKEYLKFLRRDIEAGHLPEVLAQELDFMYKWFEQLSEVAIRAVAHHKDSAGVPFWQEQTYKVVNDNWKKKSSLAFIHYYAIDEETNAKHNAKQAEGAADVAGINSGILPGTEGLPKVDPFDADGFHFPSEVHTDTGLMTFIVSTNIPGLQVVSQEPTPRWIEVEKVFEPFFDLVLITGRKSALFSQSEGLIKPCVHRVAIPLHQPRHSLLFFVDVPQ